MIIKRLNKVGNLLNLDETKRIKSGLVILEPGQEIGSHVTKGREEVIIILDGKAVVICEDEEQLVGENNLIYISSEKEHNIKNLTKDSLRYIYIVTFN